MYLSFYGLVETPFSPTPDPRFRFVTERHRDVLAELLYGVTERKGFLMLTGEIGTGKTTLVHTLRQSLDGDTAVAFVVNSMLGFDGILEYALEDFGIPTPGMTPTQRLRALHAFLVERLRTGQNVVLILDEAQNLDVPTLEQVRLLSNYETASQKLLQILLVGQPELGRRLALPELRQLLQRIAHRCRIGGLGADEVGEYVRTRLRVAGAADRGLFAPAAIGRIASYTGGVPRLINTVCDHALLIGYADQLPRIDRSTVEQAIEALEGEEGAPDSPVAEAQEPERGQGGHVSSESPRGGAAGRDRAVAVLRRAATRRASGRTAVGERAHPVRRYAAAAIATAVGLTSAVVMLAGLRPRLVDVAHSFWDLVIR